MDGTMKLVWKWINTKSISVVLWKHGSKNKDLAEPSKVKKQQVYAKKYNIKSLSSQSTQGLYESTLTST